jgi:hypothetical protein
MLPLIPVHQDVVSATQQHQAEAPTTLDEQHVQVFGGRAGAVAESSALVEECEVGCERQSVRMQEEEMGKRRTGDLVNQSAVEVLVPKELFEDPSRADGDRSGLPYIMTIQKVRMKPMATWWAEKNVNSDIFVDLWMCACEV